MTVMPLSSMQVYESVHVSFALQVCDTGLSVLGTVMVAAAAPGAPEEGEVVYGSGGKWVVRLPGS